MSKTIPGGLYRTASGDYVNASGEVREAPTKKELEDAGLPPDAFSAKAAKQAEPAAADKGPADKGGK